MQFRPCDIAGCFVIEAVPHHDVRGSFVKTFVASRFAEHSLRTDFVEDYYSKSERNVLRGMHFQLPPHDHAKLVWCVAGSVLDAVVDLRVGSPTFRMAITTELSAENCHAVYIPAGCAHGFYVSSGPATLHYKVTSEFALQSDSGIHWNSAGIHWSEQNPVVSQRDAALPKLEDFSSPFQFDGA